MMRLLPMKGSEERRGEPGTSLLFGVPSLAIAVGAMILVVSYHLVGPIGPPRFYQIELVRAVEGGGYVNYPRAPFEYILPSPELVAMLLVGMVCGCLGIAKSPPRPGSQGDPGRRRRDRMRDRARPRLAPRRQGRARVTFNSGPRSRSRAAARTGTVLSSAADRQPERRPLRRGRRRDRVQRVIGAGLHVGQVCRRTTGLRTVDASKRALISFDSPSSSDRARAGRSLSSLGLSRKPASRST